MRLLLTTARTVYAIDSSCRVVLRSATFWQAVAGCNVSWRPRVGPSREELQRGMFWRFCVRLLHK